MILLGHHLISSVKISLFIFNDRKGLTILLNSYEVLSTESEREEELCGGREWGGAGGRRYGRMQDADLDARWLLLSQYRTLGMHLLM